MKENIEVRMNKQSKLLQKSWLRPRKSRYQPLHKDRVYLKKVNMCNTHLTESPEPRGWFKLHVKFYSKENKFCIYRDMSDITQLCMIIHMKAVGFCILGLDVLS